MEVISAHIEESRIRNARNLNEDRININVFFFNIVKAAISYKENHIPGTEKNRMPSFIPVFKLHKSCNEFTLNLNILIPTLVLYSTVLSLGIMQELFNNINIIKL